MTTDNPEQRAFRSALWTTFGFGTNQVVRFGSNIVLAWLLFPEAFGVMLYINVIIQGLNMFSDVGVTASIVQNPRGDEPRFLRTAWTVQMLRGGILWLIASLLLAWPMAIVYDVPALKVYLPVAALVSLIRGFMSVEWHKRQRMLELRTVTLIMLGGQLLGSAIMIIWAVFAPSPWALIAGTLAGALWSMTASHVVLGGFPLKLELDREIVRELFEFGKWIFPSTGLTFVVTRVSPLILGLFLTVAQAGAFSIANGAANILIELSQAVTQKVLFPMYARLHQSNPEILRRRVAQARLLLMGATLPPCWVLAVFGKSIVDFIYPEAFGAAGWMLQLLAIQAAVAAVMHPAGIILLAKGDSYNHLRLLAVRSVALILVMFGGGMIAGSTGIIASMPVANLAYYPFLLVLLRKHGAWLPHIDAAGLGISAAVIGGGLAATGQL